MTAKIVESLWLRRSWRAKFSFSFAAEEGTVFLRYFPFFFFYVLLPYTFLGWFALLLIWISLPPAPLLFFLPILFLKHSNKNIWRTS